MIGSLGGTMNREKFRDSAMEGLFSVRLGPAGSKIMVQPNFDFVLYSVQGQVSRLGVLGQNGKAIEPASS